MLLVDGNGILHHRGTTVVMSSHAAGYIIIICILIGFVLACHLGVKSAIPCVGVGKNLLHVDGLLNDKQKVTDIVKTVSGAYN